MAHDNQYKESPTLFKGVKRFDYPKKGERFWDRTRHRVAIASHDLGLKYLILGDE